MRRFHVYQSPESSWPSTVENNHWHTENLLFELLKEFLWYRTGILLPPDVRDGIKVHDSQVLHQTGLQQSTVENAQHCGKCLLHATCGDLLEHSSLVSLFKSGDTISILTVPRSTDCGCTFGVVFHGHPRVFRKFELRAENKFYIAVCVSGSGRVQSVAKSVGWNTMSHWEGITRLLCYFRSQGDARLKRAGGRTGMQNNGWMTDITVQLKRWLPAEMLSAQMHVGALPFFPGRGV